DGRAVRPLRRGGEDRRGVRLAGDPRRRDGAPEHPAHLRARPRRVAGLRVRYGAGPAGDAEVRHAGPARHVQRRRALARPLRLLGVREPEPGDGAQPMKFTLSWLKDHLQTTAGVAEIAEAMTMAGLEVEHVEDPGAKFAAFSVARVKEAVQHPNADRLRVCQVETKDGVKEIVCGAPNARAGLVTIYAPIGTYIPGSGVTLEPRAVRGVVTNGMLCSAAELQIAEESDGILELDAGLAVGAGAAEALGLEAVIDFEVTPNRPDWLGVAGIARDLAAAGLGTLKDLSVAPVKGGYPCPVEIRVD